MRTIRGLVALSVILLSAGSLRAADVDANLPNDAEVVLTLNLDQLLGSPVGRKYLRSTVEEALKSNAQAQEILKTLELDPLRDISRVTVAMTSAATDNGLAIVNGKFNRDKIAKLAEQVAADRKDKFKIHKDGDTIIYEGIGDENKSVFAIFPTASTLLLSNNREMLRGSSKTGKPSRELVGLIEKVDGKQTAWLVALPSVAGALPADNADQKKALAQLEGVIGTLKVDTGARLELNLLNKSPQGAMASNKLIVDLVNVAKLFAPNAIKEKPELTPLFDIVASVRTVVRGKVLVVSGELSAAQLDKMIKQALPAK